jgi:hypothetical protein
MEDFVAKAATTSICAIMKGNGNFFLQNKVVAQCESCGSFVMAADSRDLQ